MFKDLKQGSIVYLFDKSNLTVDQCTVTKTVGPHVGKQFGMVVNVTLSNGQQYEMKDTGEVAYDKSTMITDDINKILTELRSIKLQSEEILRSADTHEFIVRRCTDLLQDLDPVYKEKQHNEERLNNIEDSITKLSSLLESISKKLN